MLAKVGEFSAFDSVNSGCQWCVTGCPHNSLGVSGCNGKMIVTPLFRRGNIE